MSFRRPQKTRLQRALREAERPISGALFLLLGAQKPEHMVDLRARFVGGVCSVLIHRRQLTMLQAEKQLNSTQLEVLQRLPEGESPPCELLWDGWLENASQASTLQAWLELGTRYVAGRLREEPDPPTVDWGQRELEFQSQLSSFRGKIEIDLRGGMFRLLDGPTVTAQSPLQVAGTYEPNEKTYTAGWADPTVSSAARPLPVFGCASRLFRVEKFEATSEAHRAAWLGKMRHLFEYHLSERVFYLGLEKLAPPGSSTTFGKEDLRPEMASRVETLLKAIRHYDPERVKSMLVSQSQEVERLLPLVEENRAIHFQVQVSAGILHDLAERISTHNMVGVRRSELSKKDRELVKTELERLKSGWE